jgi:hypothetical protein
MDYFLEQSLITDKLAQILHEEGQYIYDVVECQFESFGQGVEETVIITLFVTKNGDRLNLAISDANIFEASELSVSLRKSMVAHTGGEWTSFTLTLDSTGKAHAKFHYPEVGA